MKNKPYPLYRGFELKENFISILSYCRDQYGSKCAIRFWESKTIVERSFEDLLSDVLKLATYISNLGWKEKRIAIVSPNSYVWIVAFFAIQVCGNIVVPISNNLSSVDLTELLRKADVYGAFVSGKISIPDDVCLRYDIDKLLKSVDSLEPYQDIALLDAPSMIYFTSGSTGRNKGVMLSQRNICFDVFCMSKYCYPHDSTSAIQTLPFYHTLGLSTFIFYLLHGMDTFIERSPKHLMKDLQEISPSVTTWVPAIADGIYNNVINKIDSPWSKVKYEVMKLISGFLLFMGIDVRRMMFRNIHQLLGGNLKFVCCGGSAIREIVITEFRTWGIYIMQGYGITECSPVISVNRNYHWRDGSVGTVLPGVSVKIASDGEILVKGESVFSGYYGDACANNDAFTSDGWYQTGDIGYLDEDGFLYITGRKKNIIILSSGENISPEELEEKLLAYFSNIKEVIVFEDDGRIIAEAFVEKEEFKSLVSQELNSFNRTLSAGKHIHEIRFRDSVFPKTECGKVIRTYKGVDGHV